MYIKKQRHHFADKDPYSQGMFFSYVMYKCESWTIKKAECQRIVVLEKILESSLDSKIKLINPKGNQPIGKNSGAGKIEDKKRRKWQRMKWLDSINNSMDINMSKVWETVEDRRVSHAAIHGVTKSWTQ